MAPFFALLALLPLVAQAIPLEAQGTTIPLSKRSQLSKRGVVQPAALRAQLTNAVNKLQRGFDAFERNTGKPHPNSFPKLQKRFERVGLDPLTDDLNGTLWQGALAVGTPLKTFTVDFDTGSSDLFLPGQNCEPTANCQGHRVYNTSASRTAKDLNQTFSIEFADLSTVAGEIFSDVVNIAGLTAVGQAVGAANQFSDEFALAESPPDGLMGLAFPAVSEFGLSPVFQTLVAQKQTPPLFSVKLAVEGSELVLGGVNERLFRGPFVNLPVTEVAFWQINMDSIGVNGQTAGTQLSSIVDTGTTLIIGTTEVVTQLYAEIPGSKPAPADIGDGFFTVPCDAIPTVQTTFNGRTFSISPSSFNLGQVEEGSTDCVGGVAGMDGLPTIFILGDVFLQNVYAVFDVGKQQVGFADLA